MRIRFFNTVEPVTSFYRDLLPFLSNRGAGVEVVVSAAEYRLGRGPLDQAFGGQRIVVRRVGAGKGSSGWSAGRLKIMLGYMLRAGFLSLTGPGTELNLFLTQPPLFYVFGYLMKVLRRQRYCCLVMDQYPDVAVRYGLLKEDGLAARILLRLSRFGLKNAEAVIVIGRCMKERLVEAGVRAERVHVIPNWANEKEIVPVPREENQLRRELGLTDDFIVLYSGNIGVSHFFDDLIETARRLRSVAGLRFVVVGGGVRLREIERAKALDRLDNVILLPMQPASRLSQSLSLGDVHFISLREGFEGLLVPSKAYGALAAGRPVIYQGSPRGEIARMILEEGVGAVVGQNDPRALEAAVLEYYKNPSLAAESGRRARALAEGRYSSSASLESYGTLLLHALHCPAGLRKRRAQKKRGFGG